MNANVQDLYVLVDGTQADPGDVSRGDDGVLRHKNGMAVALKADGSPQTIADRTAMNKAAAEAGKKPAADLHLSPAADDTKVQQPKREPLMTTQDMKPAPDRKPAAV